MKNQTILSVSGLEKLKAEIVDLKKNRRPEVIERLKSARALGDLSENSEYDDARNEQSFIEGRIQELDDMIKNAKVVKENHSSGKVSLGSKVMCEIEGDKETYSLVSSIEADPLENKISVDSPFGTALMGTSVGDVVKVNAPAGELSYKILGIE